MRFEDFINQPSTDKDKKTSSQLQSTVPIKNQTPVEVKPTTKNLNPTINEPEVSTIIAPEMTADKNQLMNLETLQQNLNNCLKIIDDEVMKGYITTLANLPIVEVNSTQLDNLKPIYFFKITELVYQEDELSVSKLSTLFKALCNKSCTLVLMVKSDGRTNEFYLGVRAMSEDNSTATMFQMLKQSMLGLFPGSRVEDYLEENLQKDLNAIDFSCLSSVTCVADFRQSLDDLTDKKFIQGMEKFIDSMRGRAFQAIFIAENVGRTELEQLKRNYENIYTQISPFSNMQISFSLSSSDSTSQGKSSGTSRSTSTGKSFGISESQSQSQNFSISESQGRSSSDSKGITSSVSEGQSQTKGISRGTSTSTSDSHSKSNSNSVSRNIGWMGAGINLSHSSSQTTGHSETRGKSFGESQSNSISKTLSHGLSDSHTESTNFSSGISRSNGITSGQSKSVSENVSSGESVNFVDSLNLTSTLGTSRGITLNSQNMTLKNVLQQLEKQLKRIEDCESFGMWNFAAYFVGESAAEAESAANVYQSVVSGNKSNVENSAINTWLKPDDLGKLEPYIKNFMHPKFSYTGFDYDVSRYVEVTPAVMVSTNELAIHMGLPYRSVKGLPVIQHAAFAQEVLRHNQPKQEINLGHVYHMGEVTETEVTLDLNSLSMHTFVTGSTGAGKSNAIYNLLAEAQRNNIPFLVVEPAKGEYRKVFTDVNCFGTNPNLGALVQLNPFAFPAAIHVLEHIDRLVEIFNVCWPMYAAMPAILKESIEKAYISAGWDIVTSENLKFPGLFPTFDDVLEMLDEIVTSSTYSADTKGDYSGALATRLKSLTNGINGRIFTGNEMDLSKLFDTSAILDISRIGSMETKALIMGLTVLKLQEYRMSNATEMNSPLKHLTVLEEAHNLLKKTSTEQSAESSNMQGKSVEMLTNTIAEIRTYGEGFVIVDQAPDLLDTAVIRNTNTKIVLRLPEGNDRKITGVSMALSEKQTLEISKLLTGVAVVYQNDWQEAVLCKMPKFSPQNSFSENQTPAVKTLSLKLQTDKILHKLLKDSYTPQEISELHGLLISANASARIRRDLIRGLETKNLDFEWAMADFINKNYNLSNFFHNTGEGEWNTLGELADIISENIQAEFADFELKELLKIIYYACLAEQEKFPDNEIIGQLRADFLKEELNF